MPLGVDRSVSIFGTKYELSQHKTKPTKRHVCPPKTLISLGIRPVWSESLLSAWRKLVSLATHWAHNWADAQADLSSIGAHAILCVFVVRWLNYFIHHKQQIFQSTERRSVLFVCFALLLTIIYIYIYIHEDNQEMTQFQNEFPKTQKLRTNNDKTNATYKTTDTGTKKCNKKKKKKKNRKKALGLSSHLGLLCLSIFKKWRMTINPVEF